MSDAGGGTGKRGPLEEGCRGYRLGKAGPRKAVRVVVGARTESDVSYVPLGD